MNKLFLAAGSFLGALAVILGAFGAHALKAKLEPDQIQVFETGVRYQMYHALALILTGILFERFNNSFSSYAGYLFILGIALFSGSLYLLSCRSLLGIEGWKFIGPVTPIGGLCLIAGWILLLLSFTKK